MTIYDIKKGESDTLEFKRDLPSKDSKLMKTIVAFANSHGGKIVFGIDDENLDIIGIESERVFKFMDSLANMISETIEPQIIPRITFETIEDNNNEEKTIVIAEIQKGQNLPYFLKSEGILDGVYIRVAATSRKAERDKVKELLLIGKGQSYDKTFEEHDSIENQEIIKNFCTQIEKYNGEKSVSIENLLSWKLIKEIDNKFYPSVAFRLFADNDLHFAKIQCGLFKGTDKVFFIDRKEFEGPIFEQIENAYSFVMQHINIGAKIEGLYRKDIPEIPSEAIRELIVNAVMHRNYLSHSNIQICIFDDRLEITSPGGLFGDLTIEKMLNGSSSIRNELIADIFLKMKIVEKWGTGIKRVGVLCKNHGLKEVEYKANDESFTATILRTKKDLFDNVPLNQNVPINVPINVPLTEREKHILDLIKNNANITAKEISEIINVNEKTIKRDITELKNKNILIREGSKKSGTWVIKDEADV